MKRFLQTIDKLFMASVMAEANAHDLGRQYLQPQSGHQEKSGQNLQDFLRTVGLDNVHVYYGIAQM